MRRFQRGLASWCCVIVHSGRATHSLPIVWVLGYRGCPCQDPPVGPPMPRQDGIGDKAPTLCCACACVASSWHAHSTIWNCGVVNICADGYEMSAPPLEWADWSAQSSRTNSSALTSSLHVPTLVIGDVAIHLVDADTDLLHLDHSVSPRSTSSRLIDLECCLVCPALRFPMATSR